MEQRYTLKLVNASDGVVAVHTVSLGWSDVRALAERTLRKYEAERVEVYRYRTDETLGNYTGFAVDAA